MRVVDKAAEYGGVDSFEICGECNQPHGGLNGLLAYEPYPKTTAAVDLRAVETYRRKLRETVEGGVPVRFVGNAAFPNGTIAVEFKDVPGAKVEVDADPRYAKDFAVTEKVLDGIRTVTIAKKGASYPGIRSIALIGAK